MSVRLDRVALTDRLVTAGFGYDDADGFVSRLPDARVAPDLAWHDREAQWFAAGPPSTWDAARRNEATQHYLVGHGVDPVWLMTTYGRGVPAPQQTPPSRTGTYVAGLAFIALIGAVAWSAGRR
jgi:hypothetical protein